MSLVPLPAYPDAVPVAKKGWVLKNGKVIIRIPNLSETEVKNYYDAYIATPVSKSKKD